MRFDLRVRLAAICIVNIKVEHLAEKDAAITTLVSPLAKSW